MNGPNLLTLLRIFFVPLLVAALLGGAFVEPYLAALTGPLAITRETFALIIFLAGGHLGTEIFPKVEASQLQLRLRAPTGTRVDRTEAIALQTLDIIRNEVGSNNVALTGYELPIAVVERLVDAIRTCGS